MRTKAIDLETLARKLDISPTMHKYAVDRYSGISAYLKDCGINAAIYPQGSFRTGTVVRPLKDNIEADFDIDIVCELKLSKNDTTPQFTKTSVGDTLKSNLTYQSKLSPEQDRCWTLVYSEVSDGIGFKLDVVPCAVEDKNSILLLKTKGVQSEHAEKAVVITEKLELNEYQWVSSNPAGYGAWFDDINKRFLEDNLIQRKQAFLNENRILFASEATVEDVPDFYIKSSLQRVIQLLKRHRDIYYGRIRNGDKLRPISAIITTLAARIAESAPSANIEELMSYIVSGLQDYSSLLKGQTPAARFFGEKRIYIDKRNQKWYIGNPVNPDDNYADSWTDDTADAFFRWLSAVNEDLSNTKPDDEIRYFTNLKSGLGTSFVEMALPNPRPSAPSATIRQITSPTKPWGNIK